MLLGRARSRMLRPGGEAILLHTVRGGRGLRLPVTQRRESARMDTTTVWRELHDPLLGFITRRVPSADADDVLQDVMLRIHRHEDELDHVERVTGWVYRITTNAITDYYRQVGAAGTPSRVRTCGLPTTTPLRSAPDASDHRSAGGTGGLPATHDRPVAGEVPAGDPADRVPGHDPNRGRCCVGPVGVRTKTRTQRARMQLKQALTDCCHIELDRRAHRDRLPPAPRPMRRLRLSFQHKCCAVM